MKKIFSIISMILCLSILMMGVSAAGATTQEDPYDIYKKCMEVTGAANTMEIKMAWRITDATSNPQDISVMAASYKLAATTGDNSKFQAEILAWDSEEYLVRVYMKDGYRHDAIRREKITEQFDRNELRLILNDLTNRMYVSNPTAEKLPDGGYRLRYKTEDSGYTRHTLILNNDYTLKSVSVYSKSDSSKSSSKYDFTINEPVTIEFPYDLYSYKAA